MVPRTTFQQEEGFDPAGMVGTILKLKLKSDKWPEDDGLWTANRPVFVQFLVGQRFLQTPLELIKNS